MKTEELSRLRVIPGTIAEDLVEEKHSESQNRALEMMEEMRREFREGQGMVIRYLQAILHWVSDGTQGAVLPMATEADIFRRMMIAEGCRLVLDQHLGSGKAAAQVIATSFGRTRFYNENQVESLRRAIDREMEGRGVRHV